MFQWEQVKGRLIVSCQALPEEPLHSPFIMGRIARAAEEGGAAGIRAQSMAYILAIREAVKLPIFGLAKRNYPDSDVYITPTMREVEELLAVNCEVIALDMTCRRRPRRADIRELVKRIHQAGRLVLADISIYQIVP